MLNKALHNCISSKGTHHQKLCAIIFKKNTVISVGYNFKKTHPLQSKYKSRSFRNYLHAEIHAIIKAKQDISGYDIAIARILANGNPGCSIPCGGCLLALAEAGIENIHCFDKNGEELILNAQDFNQAYINRTRFTVDNHAKIMLKTKSENFIEVQF